MSSSDDGDRVRTAEDRAAHRLDLVHRTGSVVIGLGLWVFAVLGFAQRLEFFSTQGQPVLGLSSNGLLSTISVVFGAVLVGAGIRGGRLSSTVQVVVGALFLLSGIANVLVLNSALDVLAFRMPNVIFSLVVGGILLTVGSWGRFTGRLRADSPYARERTVGTFEDPQLSPQLSGIALDGSAAEAAAARELAEAERAVAEHRARPEVVAAVHALDGLRRPEDRIHAWQRHAPS
ncbi:DUF4383 domain-containing protein [Pseudonocardia kujensis]|uniref:DUF4383 domain-containing protein n=1 Tax=Pseudonocardia kujensis TaxID=1128675 RepID=UPI001E3569FB|nr:DUF4383 domain-containing protein [Pseudonocardia kujensis]MCE0765511.1 DUF4383 domain-containing protein [Pseudonocardia kujensis]